jgi:hypothetical protein
MRVGRACLPALVVLSLARAAFAAEGGSGIPYNAVNLSMKLLKSERINGVECVPWYVRSSDKGKVLDTANANFRIRTWDGEEIPLTFEALSSIPEEKLTEFERDMIKDEGMTHRLWIPKNVRKYVDGTIASSLPKGSIDMVQGVSISGRLPLGGKKKEERKEKDKAPLPPPVS